MCVSENRGGYQTFVWLQIWIDKNETQLELRKTQFEFVAKHDDDGGQPRGSYLSGALSFLTETDDDGFEAIEETANQNNERSSCVVLMMKVDS